MCTYTVEIAHQPSKQIGEAELPLHPAGSQGGKEGGKEGRREKGREERREGMLLAARPGTPAPSCFGFGLLPIEVSFVSPKKLVSLSFCQHR